LRLQPREFLQGRITREREEGRKGRREERGREGGAALEI